MSRPTTALLLAALGLAGCATQTPPPPPPTPTMTLTLTAATAFRDATITYTCATAGQVRTCGPEPEPATGGWKRQVTVPIGTIVRVQLTQPDHGPFTGGPSCRIADATNRLTLAHGDTRCETEAR